MTKQTEYLKLRLYDIFSTEFDKVGDLLNDIAGYNNSGFQAIDNEFKRLGKALTDMQGDFLPIDASKIMKGNIRFNPHGTYTSRPIDIRAGDNNGDALLVTTGALSVFGAGEFPQNYFTAQPNGYTATTESLVLGADQNAVLVSAYQTPTNANFAVLDTTGSFRPLAPSTGIGRAATSLGTTTSPWASAHITKVTGTLDGNAATATGARHLTSPKAVSTTLAETSPHTWGLNSTTPGHVYPLTMASGVAWNNAANAMGFWSSSGSFTSMLFRALGGNLPEIGYRRWIESTETWSPWAYAVTTPGLTSGQALVASGSQNSVVGRSITAAATSGSTALFTSGGAYTELAKKLNTNATAAAATKLATERKINGVAFDGTKDITVTATDSTKLPLTGGTIKGFLDFGNEYTGVRWNTGGKQFVLRTSGTAGACGMWLINPAGTTVMSFPNTGAGSFNGKASTCGTADNASKLNNQAASYYATKDSCDAKMPKSGGTFTGNVVAYSTNRNTYSLRNIIVQNSGGTAVSTNRIIMRRRS